MEISVIMAAYNAENLINDTIDSVLKQSFNDFEFIIIDDGSTDSTRDIIKSYTDSRIKLIENEHNFIDSINKGLSYAGGKYIAFVDNDDIMHIDRLKIEHTIMEENVQITVCSSMMKIFGENIASKLTNAPNGIVSNPLIKFIGGDFIANPTSMIRTEFVRKHYIKYEDYSFAADYKFWVSVAMAGGVFYIESQPLMYYRISKDQASQKFSKEQREASITIRNEIIRYIAEKNINNIPEFEIIFSQLNSLINKKLFTNEELCSLFHNILIKNIERIVLN